MHVPILIQRPEMLVPVLRGTPGWVWALLAALLALGIAQLRDREASLLRVSALPVAMTAFSIWGIATAFGQSPMFGYLMFAWMFVGAVTFAVIGLTSAPKGTEYEAETRTFFLPGSAIPLAIILGIFVTRYLVNVDVAIQPALVRDDAYTFAVACLYGFFSGVFLGRAARLWRLAAERAGFGLLLQRDPW